MLDKKAETNFIETQKPIIEKYLKYNYNGIETITYYEKPFKTPMGSLDIKGYVNDDKNLNFSATTYPPEGFQGGHSSSPELAEMRKPEK